MASLRTLEKRLNELAESLADFRVEINKRLTEALNDGDEAVAALDARIVALEPPPAPPIRGCSVCGEMLVVIGGPDKYAEALRDGKILLWRCDGCGATVSVNEKAVAEGKTGMEEAE